MALSDDDLLRQYIHDGSNSAFSELVRRYVDPVYSAALRQVRSNALAEDIAQSVFLDLSRHAAKLKPGQPLIAWLYLVTRRTGVDAIRRESRRHSREQTASEIAAMKSNPSQWNQVEPMLDDALEALGETDRQAILLRYMASKSLREVGDTLGTSEDAAQKRVSRALEQLRTILVRRGIAITAAGLATDLSANVVMFAPAGLSAAVSAGVFSTAALAHTVNSIAMTALNKTLITVSLVVAAGVIYQTHLVANQDNQLFAINQKIMEQQLQLERLRQDRDHTAALLTQKQKELETNQARASEEAAVDSDLEAWLGRVNQLKEQLAQMPETNIPEMQSLTSRDWMSATQNNNLQTEAKVRFALSQLRRMAKFKPEVCLNLNLALEGYRKANEGRLPTELGQLRPYLRPRLADEILQRYEFVANIASPTSEKPNRNETFQPILQEKRTVDEDYDTRLVFSKQGYAAVYTSELGDREAAARKAFMNANNDTPPTTPEQLLPYFTTPVDKIKFQEFWEARHP